MSGSGKTTFAAELARPERASPRRVAERAQTLLEERDVDAVGAWARAVCVDRDDADARREGGLRRRRAVAHDDAVTDRPSRPEDELEGAAFADPRAHQRGPAVRAPDTGAEDLAWHVRLDVAADDDAPAGEHVRASVQLQPAGDRQLRAPGLRRRCRCRRRTRCRCGRRRRWWPVRVRKRRYDEDSGRRQHTRP